MVVHVIPLLVETGQQDDFDVLVVVDVEPERQLERLLRRNGLETEAARRPDRRAGDSRAERLAVADIVLDNARRPEDLDRSGRQLVADLRRPRHHRLTYSLATLAPVPAPAGRALSYTVASSRQEDCPLNCPRCHAELPDVAHFCHVCGQDVRSDDLTRRRSFAAKPDEPVASFALVSTIMPRGAGERPQTYRIALTIALVVALVAAIFGALPIAILVAAFAIPIVYIVYLYDVNLWEDEPLPVTGLAFGLTGVLDDPLHHPGDVAAAAGRCPPRRWTAPTSAVAPVCGPSCWSRWWCRSSARRSARSVRCCWPAGPSSTT